MNYITQMNGLFARLLTNPTSKNALVLYIHLLNINNKCNWRKDFKVANRTICGLADLNKDSLWRARNELLQKNYITYKKGVGNSCGTYSILYFENSTANDNANQSANETEHRTRTLNKQNKTKQNKDEGVSLWDREYAPPKFTI